MVRAGDNELRPGIAAVRARLGNGTLRVVEGRCPNLLAEAGLYRYGPQTDGQRGEVPVDEQNHALAALRYLISRLDARQMARFRKSARPRRSTATHPPRRRCRASRRPITRNGSLTKTTGRACSDFGFPGDNRKRWIVLRWLSPSFEEELLMPIRNRIKSHRRVRAGRSGAARVQLPRPS